MAKIIPHTFLKHFDFYNPDAQIPIALLNEMLVRIQKKTGSESLVGEMPEFFRSTNMGHVSSHIFQEPNLLGLLTATASNQAILRSDFNIKLFTHGTRTRFSVKINQRKSKAVQILEDIDIARILDGFRLAIGADFTPIEVGITSDSAKPLERILPTGDYTLRTGQIESYIVFPTVHLSRKMPVSNFADSNPKDPSMPDSVSRQIQQLMDEFHPGFIPRLEEIALLAGISRRTIERRLQDEFTSFRQLRSDYLKRKSLTYLMDPSLNVLMVSQLLDFANPQNFIRSFRSWNGMTPMEYRNNL